ncbi:MAG: carboxypeptidase-like regulatory domain-containing protein, partial [Bacteroidales bacterium]|nr:carboxypeptidase-like regulatory domain-containing protein [Bacteroidales bacterium]
MKKCVIDNSSGERRTFRAFFLTMKLLTILLFAGTVTVSADVKELENQTAIAQTKKVSGRVYDSTGDVLPGVTVLVKGTRNATMTDANGQFTLSVPMNARILVFTYIGMKSQEMAIDEKSTLRVVLEDQSVGLEEVVAVGYGTQKKASVVGA